MMGMVTLEPEPKPQSLVKAIVPFILSIIVTANRVLFVDTMAAMTLTMLSPARHVGNLFTSLEQRSR
jgi:hypothetical protein